MPAYLTDPRNQILEIQRNLRDRYRTRLSILKELIQNADDAGASTMLVRLCSGEQTATNPLLRVPGLLVVNNGRFTTDHERGIRYLSATSKAEEAGAAGRFGLGQKAVFHISDAFIVAPFGYSGVFEPFIVSPFHGLEETHAQATAWENLTEVNERLGRWVDHSKFAGPHLALWLPLRQEQILLPAGQFDPWLFGRHDLLAEIMQRPMLATVMAAARHLEQLEIQQDDDPLLSLRRDGPHLAEVSRDQHDTAGSLQNRKPFAGTIQAKDGELARPFEFYARQDLSTEAIFLDVKGSPDWPRTWTVGNKSIPEKAEPHGAAFLVRHNGPESRLAIHWGVFLPIGEEPHQIISIDRSSGDAPIDLQLFLHGYFFIDAGRRYIEGFEQSAASSGSAYADICGKWNRLVRDEITLPMLPSLFVDALRGGTLSAVDLAHTVRALASHPWFIQHRAAIASREQLAEIWDGETVGWRTVPAGMALRPVLGSLFSRPETLSGLFPNLSTFARDRKIGLLAAESRVVTTLSASDPAWDPLEVADLIESMPPAVFKSRTIAEALRIFLDHACAARVDEKIGRALCSKLRESMSAEEAFAEIDTMRGILRHVPDRLLIGLHESATSAEILQALAATNREPLPVKGVWLDEAHRALLPDEDALATMLRALELLTRGPLVDRAARAAMELVRASRRQLSTLASSPVLGDIAIFPVTEEPTGVRRILSLHDLLRWSSAGALFQRQGATNVNLKSVLSALPDLRLCLTTDQDLLRAIPGFEEEQGTLDVRQAVQFVNAALRFAEPAGRLALVDRVVRDWADTERYRTAMRKLLVGVAEAGSLSVIVYSCDDNELATIAEGLLAHDQTTFVAAPDLVDRLTRPQANAIGLSKLDTHELEKLLERALAAGRPIPVTSEQAEKLLASDLPNDLLKRLPIHRLDDGSLVALDDTTYLFSDRAIPSALRLHLRRVARADNPAARKRQETLIPRHDAAAELRAALGAPDPATLAIAMLDALADPSFRDSMPDETLRAKLRFTRWLTIGSARVRPDDILCLPEAVSEAAKAVLATGAAAAWYPQGALPRLIRDHRAFPHLADLLLPGITESLEKLALLIEEAELVGLPFRYADGTAGATVSADLATLARYGASLTLPGWPLAAALLAAEAIDANGVNRCLKAFTSPPRGEAQTFAESLDTLAAHAERFGHVGEAATKLYHRAFADLIDWGPDDRCIVFRVSRVPTAAGTWRLGREVARDGAGLAPDNLLNAKLAELLRQADREADRPNATEVRAYRSNSDLPRQPLPSSARELEVISAEGHREFLARYRSRIPPELALMYLALVGRFLALREIAETWASDATLKPDILLETIDKAINPGLNRVTLASEVDQRRFLVLPLQDGEVQAVSLAGELFMAATVDGTELLVGNRHTDRGSHRVADGRVLTIHTLPLRYSNASDPYSAIQSVKKLIRSIAFDCLWLSSDQQSRAVDDLLNRFSQTSQVLLDQTRAMLCEQLPTILKPLKARTDGALGRALQSYRVAEQRRLALRGNYTERQASEQQLWDNIITDPAACDDLLQLIRAKMEELGYDNRRTVLELFQNADDASLQSDESGEACCFRLEAFAHLLRVVHWGRPINHRGADQQYGETAGYDHDLINMLVLSFSDKRPEDGVTGKFGLGFKCVHGLSDAVGVASGLISFRTRGGLLPDPWPEGVDEVDSYRRGATATLIDVPFADGRTLAGLAAIEAFELAAPYFALFAKAIRRIEIDRDGRSATYRVTEEFELPSVGSVRRIKIEGSAPLSALVFDLGEGYTLAAGLGETGVVPFPDNAPRLWHTAPLEQKVGSGWLLNGPFPLTPSRAELHGDFVPLLRRCGRVLGERLAQLYDAAVADWIGFVAALELDQEEATQLLFWRRIWDLFQRDLDDPIACELHVDGGGLAALTSYAPIVPSGLESPFEQLIRGSDAKHYFVGALTDTQVLQSITDWPSIAAASGTFTNERTARDLTRLGFDRPQPVAMTTMLQREFALVQSRISIQHAQRLGSVLSKATIVEHPLAAEYATLRRQVAGAFFRDSVDAWRPVSELTISRSTDRAEILRSRFAPPERKLSDAYKGQALQFVELAREESGYSPKPDLLHSWAERAQTQTAQGAVLRFLVEIDTGAFQARILAVPPLWMRPLGQVADGPLTGSWSREDRNQLRALLRNYEPESLVGEPASEPLSAEPVIAAIWRWWGETRDDQIDTYERAVYPSGYDQQRLGNWNDREAWFTLFALATFQNFGGTQDGQHRTFVQEGMQRGWWSELAQSRPPDAPEVWLSRLKSWSSAELPDITHWRWRRALLDLYAIARWLPQYIRIVELFPRAIQEHGKIRLSDALTPSFSPIWQQAGIEAAPLVRTLGIGFNWLLRECVRLRIYDHGAARLVAPFGWGTTWRLRNLLNRRLGAGLDDKASMDGSPAVWRFVEPCVPDNHRRILESDLDLPLQLVTLLRNQSALADCLSAAGVQSLPLAVVDEHDVTDPDDDSLEAAE